MDINVRVVITAIICLTIIELTAMALGFNGQLLRWMVIAIAGLAGFMIPAPFKMRENNGQEKGN